MVNLNSAKGSVVEMKDVSKEISVISVISVVRCSVEVYGKKINGVYDFCDLRIKVDYDSLEKKDSYDFTEGETALKRLFNYKLTQAIFDLDYCSSMREKYEFKPISDLYEVLWEDDPIVNSSDTLVSSTRNIARCCSEIKSKRGRWVDWEYNYKQFSKVEFKGDEKLESFAKSVATIGNFIPVPAKHQSLLMCKDERYDRVLDLFKSLYCNDLRVSNDYPVDEQIMKWLSHYWKENGEKSWENFVDKNYLKGSFVNENYEVVKYDGTLCQLSKFIYARSVVMLNEYKKRLGQMVSNNSRKL